MPLPFDPSLALSALLAWSAQAAILTAAAALAATTVAHPKGRLALWQGLLGVLVLLPAIEPWKAAPLPLIAPVPEAALALVSAAAPVQAGFHWRPEYWLWLIAAVAALRLVYTIAGFLRLRQYCRNARRITPPLPFADRSITWYASDSVPGPVTYGWREPVILLPSKTLQLPAELREAIQCHELIHVRRGDWLWMVAETILRSLLWFHPAIWFVTSRIQLSREQVVDREAIELLQDREVYLDALVAVAEYQLRPELTPAPLFLRKRHLKARVTAVLKELPMSRSRMFAGFAPVCSLAPIAAFAAAWLFPFVAPPQTSAQVVEGKMVTAAAADSPGITVEPGGVLLHRSAVRMPANPTAGGKVVLEATLNAQGEVTDARVISGPQELRSAALSSVLQWHYQPGPPVAEIAIQFGASAAAAPPKPPEVAAAQSPATLKSIQFSGITPEAERQLRQLLPVHEGDAVSRQDISAAQAAVRSFDSHLATTYRIDRGGDATLSIYPAPTASATAAPSPAPGVYRPGGDVTNPIPIVHPEPEYSEEARKARWGGTVLLSVVVDENGATKDIRVIKPLGLGLDEKAIEAVSHWSFKPGMKNGVPVPVAAQIEVTFRPNQ